MDPNIKLRIAEDIGSQESLRLHNKIGELYRALIHRFCPWSLVQPMVMSFRIEA